eukprot:GEMP01036333.1.p1 GENE.GEMP01036333.1~~GEMP01036333.1.p1  ORF type:complete len:403 (+),score=94.89 GEMP01036333.1:141-1349(+)
MSLFAHIQMAPPDAILDTARAFKEDPAPNKVNLGIGAYRTEEGKPYILPIIRKAEEEILQETGTTVNKEYSPIDGKPELKSLTQKLYFGQVSDRIASTQALSGTGALRIAADFIKKHIAEASHTVYMSAPTWGNHKAIFSTAGMKVEEYPYWNAETRGINFKGMMDKLTSIPERSTVLLHACAHNPTGVDPSNEQWQEIVKVCKDRKLLPILDNAYQGYASGDIERDGYSARLFFDSGMEFFACQSFAKNMGLYGERMGMLHVICPNKEEAATTLSQVKLVIRPMYSSPPIHGAFLVEKVLGNDAYRAQWARELKAMADRVLEVRDLLRKGLEAKGTPGTWNHITDQIGMFSFTGLTVPQVEKLTKVYHVYLLKSGRISLAGLNKANIPYFVDAVDDVVRTA